MNVTSTPPKNVTVKTAYVDVSASGANDVLAAPTTTDVAIRVLSVAVVTTLANAIKFTSGTGATQITATWPLAANGGLVLPFNEHGWFQCAGGDKLAINLGTATATGVHIQYMIL